MYTHYIHTLSFHQLYNSTKRTYEKLLHTQALTTEKYLIGAFEAEGLFLGFASVADLFMKFIFNFFLTKALFQSAVFSDF